MKEMYLKESRALLSLQWKSDEGLFEKVVKSCQNLNQATLKAMEKMGEGKGALSGIRFHFRSIMKQAKANFEETPAYSELEKVVASIESSLQTGSMN